MSTEALRVNELARRGQFAAARREADDGRAAPAASPLAQATAQEARGEIERLAGAPGLAAAGLAERVRTALASLAAQPGRAPA